MHFTFFLEMGQKANLIFFLLMLFTHFFGLTSYFGRASDDSSKDGMVPVP